MENEIYYAIKEAIQVMETYNTGEDFALVSSLRRMHELVMQAEVSDGAVGAAVGQRSVGTVAVARYFRHCYIRTKIGCHCTDECGYDALMSEAPSGGQP